MAARQVGDSTSVLGEKAAQIPTHLPEEEALGNLPGLAILADHHFLSMMVMLGWVI
jgi:hypothetical protein